jgi:hypothetical protein
MPHCSVAAEDCGPVTLNITATLVPVLSGGKLADITKFAYAVGQVIKQAVARANRFARKSAPAFSRSKDDDEDKHQPGKLYRILEDAASLEFCSVDELAVLSKGKDPYRLDTAAGHRLGRWCADLIERFLPPEAQIHLRGLQFLLASAADVRRPDGSLYINTLETWRWLTETAMKAVRWLLYVPSTELLTSEMRPRNYISRPTTRWSPSAAMEKESSFQTSLKQCPASLRPRSRSFNLTGSS